MKKMNNFNAMNILSDGQPMYKRKNMRWTNNITAVKDRVVKYIETAL